MARLPFHNVANNWERELNTAINSSITSVVIKIASGGVAGCPAVPFFCHCEDEIMICTDVNEGTNTLTVERGACGTTAEAHNAGMTFAHYNYAEQVQELQRKLGAAEMLINQILGGSTGIPRTSENGELKVVPSDPVSMTVTVQAGGALISNECAALLANDTATFTAPSSPNSRIDLIQLDQNGEVTVKAGTAGVSPSAPSDDSDKITLAEIYIRYNSTSIKATDDATNGYITDRRAYI